MWRKLFSGFYQLPKVSPVEGFLLRLFFAAFLIFTVRSQVTYTAEPHPKGILTVLHWADGVKAEPKSSNPIRAAWQTTGEYFRAACGEGITVIFGKGPYLTWLANPEAWAIYKGIFIALLAVYVAGYGLVLVTPALAIMHLLPFTLYASQGFNHHGNQIVTCTLIIQAICVIWYSTRHKLTITPPEERLSGWMLVQSQVILTGMYFISVFTKLDKSNGMWLSNSKYVAMDMLKTQRQSYLNELDPAFAGNPPEAIWMLDHPFLATLFFGSGLFLEFFCIFAIGNRWLGFLIGVSLIVMHRSIDRLMGGVAFLNNELLAFIFLVNIPFLIACVVNWLPKLRARHLAVAGGVAGIALSFWTQPQSVRTDFTDGGTVGVLQGVGNYLLKLINNMDTWNSFDPEQWHKTIIFVTPAILTSIGCAVLGAVIGSFLGGGSGKTEGSSNEDTAAARTA